MAATTSKEILRRIRLRGPGSVFTASDFMSTGAARDAIDQTLSRLARQGTIRRLTHGIYDYPRINERLGVLSPSEEAIATAIARRDGIRIQPSGHTAANALGLSTQVPAKIVYLTDGRSRTIRALDRDIEFQHAKLGSATGTAALAINALRALGPQAASEPRIASALRDRLAPTDRRRLIDDIRNLPTWMRPIVRDIAIGARE